MTKFSAPIVIASDGETGFFVTTESNSFDRSSSRPYSSSSMTPEIATVAPAFAAASNASQHFCVKTPGEGTMINFAFKA